MARPGKVWWNTQKKAWYSTFDGTKKVKVADGDKTEAEAVELWHQAHAKEIAVDLKHCNPLRVIFEMYMDWRLPRHPDSCRMYRLFLQSFLDFAKCNRVGRDYQGDMLVRELTAASVAQWLDEHRSWGQTTRSMAVAVLQAALNWAAKPERRLIERNPIAGMSKPAIRSRGEEAVLPTDIMARLAAEAPPALADFLFALRQTGTRPVHLRRVTAADVHFDRSCMTIWKHKTAQRTGQPVHVPITPALEPLLRRLCALHPDGPIFRGERGKPWGDRNLRLQFQALKDRLGLDSSVVLYGYRHTTATELLLAGMPDAKVAAVLGHADTKMLYKHYGHLGRHIKTLAGEMGSIIESAGKAPPAPSKPGEGGGENA